MVGIMPDRPDRHSQGSTIAATDGAPFRNRTYANGPRDAASACRLGEAVGAGDQGAVRAPQRDDVSGDRRCPLVEPPRRGFVRVPEDHLADLAARSPPLAARDAVFAAFLQRCHAKLIQINSGSLMFTLSGCLADHVTGSYPIGRASERADLSGGCSMASSVGETCGHGGHVPAAWPGLSDRSNYPFVR
jgi:hypothetical protein